MRRISFIRFDGVLQCAADPRMSVVAQVRCKLSGFPEPNPMIACAEVVFTNSKGLARARRAEIRRARLEGRHGDAERLAAAVHAERRLLLSERKRKLEVDAYCIYFP